MTLFDFAATYPTHPGFKEKSGTSQEAAEKVSNRAGLIREKVVAALHRYGPMTADEAADRIGEKPNNVRPRCSEMKDLGIVRKTSMRRKNQDGNNQVVWELVPVVGA